MDTFQLLTTLQFFTLTVLYQLDNLFSCQHAIRFITNNQHDEDRLLYRHTIEHLWCKLCLYNYEFIDISSGYAESTYISRHYQ